MTVIWVGERKMMSVYRLGRDSKREGQEGRKENEGKGHWDGMKVLVWDKGPFRGDPV